MLYKLKIFLNIFILTGTCWRLDPCGRPSLRGLRKTMLISTQFWIRKEMKTGGVGSYMNSKSLCFLLFSFNKTKENCLPVYLKRWDTERIISSWWLFPYCMCTLRSGQARDRRKEEKWRGGIYSTHTYTVANLNQN